MRRTTWLAAAVLALAIAPAAHAHPLPTHGKVPFGLTSPLSIGEGVSYVAGDNGFTGGHVVVEGDRLYLGSYGRGMHIYDIS